MNQNQGMQIDVSLQKNPPIPVFLQNAVIDKPAPALFENAGIENPITAFFKNAGIGSQKTLGQGYRFPLWGKTYLDAFKSAGIGLSL